MKYHYHIIVIGGGHAGCEAAVAAARLGSDTLLITADMNRIAHMSCNPAIGGIAKGQIVREIDALGGMTGIVTDRSSIQFKLLNMSKGPAVWSPRSQCDRTRFSDEWRRVLDSTPNLSIFQDYAAGFIVNSDGEKPHITGLRTALGVEFTADMFILTAGTFLNGELHFGMHRTPGGRIAEAASAGITEQLRDLGLTPMRMKTGTPMRIDGRSIDYSLVQTDGGDNPGGFHKFSFLPDVKSELRQRDCYIVHTNPEVHNILRDNLDRSPLYNGRIQSIGPRYCPSIETKIVTFAERDSHQLFLEPEGETSQEFYVNGFSSSLPWDVQFEAISKVPALRDVAIYRPGYAIEYDCFDPTGLTHDLRSKYVDNLYLAGQVNGTTGYEEAAGQGLVAGINAHRKRVGESPFVLSRDAAYIGVLIDDLVTKGVDEPYRMFTSRAEYRILLRQDDADMRLTPLGREVGLVSDERYQLMISKRSERDRLIEFCKGLKVREGAVSVPNPDGSVTPVSRGTNLYDLLLRPNVTFASLAPQLPVLAERLNAITDVRRPEIIEAAEILIKYSGYIERERQLADKMQRLDYVKLPDDTDYMNINSLSTEARQKLTRIRPANIGQASRIPGVSPADVSILLMLMGR